MNPFVAAALSAGISQAAIDSFLANNPGDEHRLPTAFGFSESGIVPTTGAATPIPFAVPFTSTHTGAGGLSPMLLLLAAGAAWWWFKGRKG